MAPTLTHPRGRTVTVPKGSVEYYTSKGWSVAGKAAEAAPVSGIPEGPFDTSWTIKQLTAYAEREQVDLEGATKKDEILLTLEVAKEAADAAVAGNDGSEGDNDGANASEGDTVPPQSDD